MKHRTNYIAVKFKMKPKNKKLIICIFLIGILFFSISMINSQNYYTHSPSKNKDNVLVFFSDDEIRNYNAHFQIDFLDPSNARKLKKLGTMFVNTDFQSLDSMELYYQLLETEPFSPEREDFMNKYFYNYAWNNHTIDKGDNIIVKILYENNTEIIPMEIMNYKGKIDVLFFRSHMNRNGILVNGNRYINVSDISSWKKKYKKLNSKLSKDASIMFSGCSFAYNYTLPDETGAEAMSKVFKRPVHASESHLGGTLDTQNWEKVSYGVFKEVEGGRFLK